MFPSEKDLALLLDEARHIERKASLSFPKTPSLEKTLEMLAPIPQNALLLGAAYDNLPVMFDLWKPRPGGLLVTGDAGAGKTSYLQFVARAAAALHSPRHLRFGILSNYPEEWRSILSIPHCLGVFPFYQRSASSFIYTLAEWIYAPSDETEEIILLFLDDLTRIFHEEIEVQENLRWILEKGNTKRVLPIVSLNAAEHFQSREWLPLFQAKIYGKIANPFPSKNVPFPSLHAGSEFALREPKGWLRFWIPSS